MRSSGSNFTSVLQLVQAMGVRPARYCSTKGRTTRCFELLLEIDDVMRKIQMLSDALGVVDVVERAATMLRGAVALQFGEAALIPKLHGEADDGMALLEEHGRDGGGIDAAGHGYGDEAGLWSRRPGAGNRVVFAQACNEHFTVYGEWWKFGG